MGERLVGLGHLVRVFFLLDGSAPVVESIQELEGDFCALEFLNA